MSNLLPCPFCGDELKVYGPENWKPTYYDPDSGGDPYTAVCECGFQFQKNHYDYAEFIAAVNRRHQPEDKPLTPCDLCAYGPPSSADGKPCVMCPAHSKPKGE